MNKELLYRFFEGRASAEEMKSIKEWSESSDDNHRSLLRERRLFDAMLVLGSMPIEKDAQPAQPFLRSRRFLRELLKIAAIIAVTICMTATWFSIVGNNNDTRVAMQTVTVPAGQRANVTLADGTNVWLNAGTTLIYPSVFADDRREVILDGEAYFDVTHNEEQPFRVRTHQMDIEVLGTEFNVEAYADRGLFETSLIRGCVKVCSSSNPEQHVTLAPNQKTRMQDGQFVVEDIEDYDVYRWREGLYCFHEKPLADIMKDLEKYFDLEIRLENPHLAGIVLTGKFRIPEGLDYILRVLQLDVNFTYRRDVEQNILYIN